MGDFKKSRRSRARDAKGERGVTLAGQRHAVKDSFPLGQANSNAANFAANFRFGIFHSPVDW